MCKTFNMRIFSGVSRTDKVTKITIIYTKIDMWFLVNNTWIAETQNISIELKMRAVHSYYQSDLYTE